MGGREEVREGGMVWLSGRKGGGEGGRVSRKGGEWRVEGVAYGGD